MADALRVGVVANWVRRTATVLRFGARPRRESGGRRRRRRAEDASGSEAVAAPTMPRSSMKRMTSSSPWPVLRLVNTNGRSPRIFRASRSMTSSDAPTMRREVDLVDDEQVRARDAGAALARNLVAGRDVDHVEREVGKLRAERRGQVVAAALDDDEVEIAEAPREPVDRLEVDRGVLADRRVRAAAGLDADDALRRAAPRCAPGTARLPRCRCRW